MKLQIFVVNRMVKKFRKSRCKRNQYGGGPGGGLGFAVGDNTMNNPLAYESTGNCIAHVAPGHLPGPANNQQGLPGMNPEGLSLMKGGRRRGSRSRRSRSRSRRRRQSGGGYGIAPYDGMVTGSPGNSGIASVVRTACEASSSAVPDPMSAGVLNSRGELWDGPVGTRGNIPMQVGGGHVEGAPFINEHAAARTVLNGPESVIKAADGTNLMVNVPVNGNAANPACVKTGGARRGRIPTRRRRGSRKSRSRRSSRRS